MAKAPARKPLSDRDQKRLWGKAAARCSYEGCRRKLIREFPETGEAAVIGQHAHQKPHSPQGPRGLKGDDKPWEQPIDPTGPATYENTILVCGSCHTTIDQAPKAHPVELLAAMKLMHERWVQRRLERRRSKATKQPAAQVTSDVEIVVKESKRQVGFYSAMVRGNSEISRLWDSGLLGGPRREPRPRVSGVKSGPPQTVFDVKIMNRGSVSLQMQDFRLLVDGMEVELSGTSILHNSLETAFKEPLNTKRAQVIEVKAHHLAKHLRGRGFTSPVSLSFAFRDVCNEEFLHEYGPFDPMAYPDTPDTVQFEEWD